jgi:hypothetical protein
VDIDDCPRVRIPPCLRVVSTLLGIETEAS